MMLIKKCGIQIDFIDQGVTIITSEDNTSTDDGSSADQNTTDNSSGDNGSSADDNTSGEDTAE